MTLTNPNCLLTSSLNNEKDIFGLKFKISERRLDLNGIPSHPTQDAWIPSKRTELAFSKIIDLIDKELLTMPGLSFPDQSADLISEKYYDELNSVGNTNNKTLSIENVSEAEHVLYDLIQVEKYQAAVCLTSKLLTNLGQGVGKAGLLSKHTELSIQIWFTRLALLVKLEEFKKADIEGSAWWDCDRPDLYYQFYPEIYKGRLGTMVPFQMRLLLATLPGHCGRHSEALKRLFSILATVKKIIENLSRELVVDVNKSDMSPCDKTSSVELWIARQKRILISIINVAVEMQDFLLALNVLHKFLENEESRDAKQVLHSVIGRIYLQLGDLSGAKKNFKLARAFNTVIEDLDFEYNVNEALIAIANNNYPDAYKFFEKASLIDPSNIMVMNNCAVCLMFMKHLKEAIRLLYGTISNNPKKALQNSVLLNLCSLLEQEGSYNWNKIIDLLKFIGWFKGDSINIRSLKLRTSIRD